ncbi:hypothetical protein AB0D65_08100 [Streptomyces griseoloalbus]|uniref:Uncharacterized protein n=1 Tax=Streptomyces griseoloalbus TaxID=67303 RepID=A0ABV3E1F3_9ACTN
MPTSFSRILNEQDLAEVRNQYLQALEALEEEEEEEAEEEGTGADEASHRSSGGPATEQNQQD